LSYLKQAPHNSLAGRLVKPKTQPKDVSALTEKRRLERLTREQKEAEISAKRIEERLARDAKKGFSVLLSRIESINKFLKLKILTRRSALFKTTQINSILSVHYSIRLDLFPLHNPL
jgi:hypothetical protein